MKSIREAHCVKFHSDEENGDIRHLIRNNLMLLKRVLVASIS